MLKSAETPGATLIREYLEKALGNDSYLHSQMRKFASIDGDDQEARALFAAEAESTSLRQELLRTMLQQFGRESFSGQIQSPELLVALPEVERADRTPAERLLHALIAAYTIESGARAIYGSLAAVATACGDAATGDFARRVESETRRTGQDFFHFLSSRSKIAFNMLTLTEVDPSVQTKIADDLQ